MSKISNDNINHVNHVNGIDGEKRHLLFSNATEIIVFDTIYVDLRCSEHGFVWYSQYLSILALLLQVQVKSFILNVTNAGKLN